MSPETKQRSSGNLVEELTSFVGRKGEIAEIRRLLSASRLVTLTGIGGVGKTRLALRVGTELSRAFPDGVWFVDLAQVHEPDMLAHTAAQALGVRDQSARDPITVVSTYLSKKRLLLLLDNCEQVIDDCAEFAMAVLQAAPELRILATSRLPLSVYGERIWEVLPLSSPPAEERFTPGTAETQDAVTLFGQRTAAVLPGFSITAENQSTVARICRELEGIPLAIELGVAHMRHMSLDQLLSRLDNRYLLLARGSSTKPSRHQTLRAAIDWSYDLCSPEERSLWARLSVFSGGFTLEAVEEVCSGDGLAAPSILDVLSGLVEKSIVLRSRPGSTESPFVRFQLLGTLREYGHERLAPGEKEELRRRHLEWFAQFADQGARQWFGPDQLEWRRRVEAEHSNLRGALEFCLAEPERVQVGLEMAGALWFYWTSCGLMVEGRQWLDRLLALDEKPTLARGTALWVCSWLCSHQGDPISGEEGGERARDVAEHLGDARLAAYAQHTAGIAAMAQGDAVRATALCEDAWARHRVVGVTSAATMALVQLAFVASLQGDYNRAAAYSEECLLVTSDHSESWAHSWGLTTLGLALCLRGDAPQAVARLQKAIAIKRDLRDLFGLGMAVEFLSWTLASEGRHKQAARLYGALEPLWALNGVPLMGSPQLLVFRQEQQTATRSVLGAEAFNVIVGEGEEMSTEQACEYALAGMEEPARSTAHATSDDSRRPLLTRREQEVAKLVAKGMSNKDIAAALVISVRTVEAHVEHIMTKLGCNSRSLVAAWVATQHSARQSSQADMDHR
ncbi:ATP-binding protein [Streptomyces chartreusis]|uniref:ATP-binding protein n=1 Tax=Streptomyces chartreusis TaxID=1969 RepID=UPI0037FB93C5